MVEAAEAAKEFELCLARSLGLCHTAGNTIAHDVLDVDTAVSSSASFKQKSTIGVMLSGTTVDNIVVGGPAYGKMAKGDTIKQVDGQKAKSDNIATLLYGSDVPGSEVKIEFLSSKGQAKKITLRRMKVEAIADKHQMFHLFTEVKKAASKHSDASMGALVDKSIDHWTKMLIADAEHDQKICDNVETMQRFAQDTLATLTSELESMAGFSQTCFTYSDLLGDQKVSRWGDTLKLIRKEIKSNKSADSVSAKAKVSQHAQETEAAQKALEDANRQVEALWDERDTLRSALDDANRLNAELQAELAELMGGREQHEQDMLLTANALEEKAVAAFAAKLAAERDLAALREDMAAMKDKHRASAADTAELTSLVERLRRQCAHMQEDQSKLEAERDEAVAKQQSTVLRVMSLEKALADAEAALQQLRENTNRELASRQMRIADLEAELARLSAALKQQEREVEALHDSMARLRDERNAARGAAQRDGERLVAKTTEVQRIEQTLDQQRRDLSQRQARIDELEEALLRAQQLGDKTVADFAQARSAWAASQLAHEERARTLHERLHAVIKAAQAMYVAISQPSAGAVTGLGLILQPRDSGTAAGAQVGDVLAGSVAAVDGRIVAGDMVVAVNGVSVEGRTAQEIEILMCGPIWTKIVTAVQKAGGSHEKIQVELMRGFGEDETSCVQAVVGYMQQEAVSTARRTLEELELIKLQLSSEVDLHKADNQQFLQDKERLQTEVDQAQHREQRAEQLRRETAEAFSAYKQQCVLQQQRSTVSVENLSQIARAFVGEASACMRGIDDDTSIMQASLSRLSGEVQRLESEHAALSKSHTDALERLDRSKVDLEGLQKQNILLSTSLDAAQVKVAEHERESRDLAAKLLRAGRERDTLQNNLGAVMPQLQDAQAAVGKLEGLVETHEREGEALAAKVHCLEVQVQELSLQLRNVMSANSALEIDGKAAQVKIGRMEAEAQRVESAAAEERVRTAGIEAELASLHDSMRVKRTEAHQREYEMAAAQAEARRLQALSEATQRAAEDAKSALLLATHTRDKRTTQLRAALRCAETMYGCACKPVVGVVTGLGLVLEATSDADGSNGVAVAEVLAQSAAFDSQQIAPKDTILEIDSSVVTGMELQEVEKCLSGLVFSPVKIKLNRFVGGTYVVELERRNGQDDVDSALDRLEQHLREDTCKAVNLMHYDLDSIKTQLLKSFSKYEKENKEWTQDKDALMSEITALKLQLAAADKHQQALAEDMRQQQEQHSKDRSDLSLKHADARRAATEAQRELDALLSTHCQLKSEMQKSHSAQQESEIAATRAQKEAEDLRSEAKAAFATAEQLKAQLTSAAAKLDEAQARILKLETAAAAADASTASVKQELADANADKDKMTTEIVNHKKSSSMVQRELEEALAVAARLRAEKEALQTRLIDEATRIKALEEELAGAEKQLGEKRREAQTMMDDYHSLEQDLGAKTSEEAEARSKLQEATRVWDTARLSYQEYSDSMRARMAEAAKVAQAMYVAICRPSVSAATGLGLVLASAEGGRNPVIQELVEGGTALACGKMNKGDTVLAVNGIATQDVSLEDVEISLCGAVGTTVTIRAVTVGSKKAYEVALVRNAGAPDEAAIASLVSTLLPEAVGVAARMHEELEDLRARAKADADQHEETSLRWQTETEQLRADLADAHRRLELASKDAEEALRDKQDLDTQIRQQRDDMQRKIDEAKAATADALTQLDAQERATMVGKTKLVNLKGATEEAEKAARTAAKQALDANTALEAAQEACRKESEKAAMAAAKLDALSVRVMGLESALAEGEGALQRLTNDCADKDATIQKLQSEASALKQQVDKQEHELEAAQERGTRLREEKNEAVKQVKQEQKRVSAREAEVEVSADKLAKSVKECKEFQDRIVTLQDGLREELGKHQETARELDAARAQEEILTERCSSQESDLKKVLSAYQELQKIICTPLVGGLYGVGITVKQHEETGKSIGAIAAGMSAAVSGKLEVDDVILQVDATPVQDLPVDKVQALMVGALGTNVKIKVSSAGSAKTVTDTLTRGSCATTTADGLVSRAPEARKALEDFLKEHADLRKALKNAEAAATAGANDAKKASAERIQQLEADMVKLHKREAESDKALAQLRDAKRALESERDTLKQELADLHKTAAGAVKLQEALKSLKQQLSDATAKLKRDAEELATQKKQLQHDADEIAVLKKAAAVSADAHKKELQKLSAGPCNRCKGKDPGSMLPPLAPSTKPPPSPRVTAPSPRGKENQETPRAPLSARGAPKLVGVGVRLTDNSPHCVAEFVRDGPAHRCGKIQAGDHLLEVDGEDIQTLPIAQIAAKIVGPEGSELRLKFARGNGADATVFDVSLTRGSSSGHS